MLPQKEEAIEILKNSSNMSEGLLQLIEFLDRGWYTKISSKGIERLKPNLSLALLAYGIEGEVLKSSITENLFINDGPNGNIERIHHMDLDKIKKNYEKLLFRNDFVYSLKYGNELLLRDRNEFFKITYDFVLRDNPNLLKTLILNSFEKIQNMDTKFLTFTLSYLTKARSDFRFFENSNLQNTELDLEKIIENFLHLSDEKLLSKEGLAALSYLEALKLRFKNEAVPNIIKNIAFYHTELVKKDDVEILHGEDEKQLAKKLIEILKK